jgi:hypothetical protein
MKQNKGAELHPTATLFGLRIREISSSFRGMVTSGKRRVRGRTPGWPRILARPLDAIVPARA